jgi:hypothetical protein
MIKVNYNFFRVSKTSEIIKTFQSLNIILSYLNTQQKEKIKLNLNHINYSHRIENFSYLFEVVSGNTKIIFLILPPLQDRRYDEIEKFVEYIDSCIENKGLDKSKWNKIIIDIYKSRPMNDNVIFYDKNDFINLVYQHQEKRIEFQGFCSSRIKYILDTNYILYLKEKLRSISPGKEDSSKYEEVIKSIFDFILSYHYRSGILRKRNHNNKYERDIIYDISMSTDESFKETKNKYNATHLVIECKNSSDKEVIKKGVTQIINYFDLGETGRFGIIVARSIQNRKDLYHYWESLKNKKNMIILLDDKQIIDLLDQYSNKKLVIIKENDKRYIVKPTGEMILHSLVMDTLASI